MVAQTSPPVTNEDFKGNDRILFGMIFGVLAFWLFAQTTLNIAPVMATELGIETSIMSAILHLSIRTKTPADRQLVLDRTRTLTRHQAESFGCTFEIREGIPGAVLVNSEKETLEAYEIAKSTFGVDEVHYPAPTFLGSEDFAFMLQQRPGTYCFIDNGDTPMVHHPEFTFNPKLLTKGAA